MVWKRRTCKQMAVSCLRDRSASLWHPWNQHLHHNVCEAIAEKWVLNCGHTRRNFLDECFVHWCNRGMRGVGRCGHMLGLRQLRYPKHDVGNELHAGRTVEFMN